MYRRLSSTLALGLVAVMAMAVTAPAATWKIDPTHSELTFKVRHLFSKTGGEFGKWSGTLEFDPENLSGGSVELTIDAATIDTDNDKRDQHLRSDDFFHVTEYPEINFASSKIVEDGGQWELHGDLTMHGVTKPVVIPFEFHGVGPDPWGGTRAGFSGELTLNRKDFGIAWNQALDQGGLVLGDEVHIDIEIEAAKVQPGR